jgi:DNA-binding NarL/FixJ family response regulator
MAFKCCLAGIDRSLIPMFTGVFIAAGVPTLLSAARLDVVELCALRPNLLVCDVDAVEVEPLELLRQLRFVLPECLIVLFTDLMLRSWSIECHLAGVNAMLSKDSSERHLADGVRSVMRSGCYTDPRFAAG